MMRLEVRLMNNDATVIFDRNLINEEKMKFIVRDVYLALKERGYNPINQIVGYLMTGDLGYISSYKDARIKMSKIDRASLLEMMLKGYLK